MVPGEQAAVVCAVVLLVAASTPAAAIGPVEPQSVAGQSAAVTAASGPPEQTTRERAHTSTNATSPRDVWVVANTTDASAEFVRFTDVVPAADGGFLVVGVAGTQGYATKVTRNGTTVWRRTYRSAERATPLGRSNVVRGVARHPDGGYVLVGSDADGAAWVVRIESDGDHLWNRSLGDPNGTGGLTSVVVRPDGEILATGYVGGANAVVRLDTDGELLGRVAPTEPVSSLRDIEPAGTPGEYPVAGTVETGPEAEDAYDAFVARYDADNRSFVWTRSFGGTASDGATGVTATDDGVYAVGYASSPVDDSPSSEFAGLAAKLSPRGAVRWSEVVAQPHEVQFEDVAVGANGVVAVGMGNATADPDGSSSGLAVGLGSEEHVRFTRELGGAERQRLNAVAGTSDGFVAVGDALAPSGSDTSKGWFVRGVGDTLVVDADGGGDYRTIGAAVDAAGDGDRVVVRPGTYREQVVVDANLTLVAPDGATIEGAGVDADAGVRVARDAGPLSWTLAGFRVANASRGVAADGTAGNWTIRNVTFVGTETAVAADRTDGAATVANATLLNATLAARNATGDWTVRDLRAPNASRAVLDARDSTGDWTVDGLRVRNGTATAVVAVGAAGDWTVRDATVSTLGLGVNAWNTTGDWTVRGSRLSPSPELRRGGFSARASAIDAPGAAGEWVVADSTLYYLVAHTTTGAWTVRGSSVELGVDAMESAGDWRVEDGVVGEGGISARSTNGSWVVEGTLFDGGTLSAGGSSGDWTVARSTFRGRGRNYAPIGAWESSGNWTVRNSVIRDAAAPGIGALGSSGDWTVRNATIAEVTNGVNGHESSGDWTVRDTYVASTTVGTVVDVGLRGDESTGNWTVVRSDVVAETGVGVNASGSEGAWTVRGTVVRGGRTGVDAGRANGSWAIANATLVGAAADDGDGGLRAGTGVYAAGVGGRWSVRGSNLHRHDRAAVDATGAAPAVNATGNWWGTGGEADCRGAVACDRALSTPADGPPERFGPPGPGVDRPRPTPTSTACPRTSTATATWTSATPSPSRLRTSSR